MDMGAFTRINDLDKIREANGIDVPRLRGLTLMKDYKPVSEEFIQREIDEEYSRAARNIYYYLGEMAEDILSGNVDKYFADKSWLETQEEMIGSGFEGLMKRYYELANKYAGRDDVLCVHARIGSTSWSDIKWRHLRDRPWFLDACDEAYDTSYCDIYAKIDPKTVYKEEEN